MDKVTVTNLDAHQDFDERVRSLENYKYFVKGGTAVLMVLIGVGVWQWPKAGKRGDPGEDAVGAPVGAIVAWMSDKELPDGWHACDGTNIDDIRVKGLDGERGLRPPEVERLRKSVVLKTPNNDLTLPDLRGYFLQGASDADPVASREGAREFIVQVRNFDKPGGSTNSYMGNTLESGRGNGQPARDMVPRGDSKKNEYVLDNRPPFVAVHWIIRVK